MPCPARGYGTAGIQTNLLGCTGQVPDTERRGHGGAGWRQEGAGGRSELRSPVLDFLAAVAWALGARLRFSGLGWHGYFPVRKELEGGSGFFEIRSSSVSWGPV
jgi:hypothetical protein